MQTITWSATKARNEFFDLLTQVAMGQSFIVERDKKEVALVTPIKKGTDWKGLKKAMDALHGVAKDFDLSKSPLRNKRARLWLKRIRNY
ncbi:hypothetical protein COX03_02840 [Candidatus Woesebacteria bacterium CG22_combo_CG10-13_8_21_14_all_39_10]|uniref:Antitoxin n=2 Tax=Candidatus Woeseibacteriota TaxID=1752722 RepID=A0A2H0BIN3_9BACT|nr:MAG: hypothetical protein COX03_02840 [Candidatus Woesebacteria bacterium CG22_combo_CG10-13_8_21_14_all_39_10]PIZ48601.1 MAG: hypothetical protein COY29_03390 [Candidatus Woesebacteria bacterium CG_4_10_14_0_2_um_filter_39_14]